MGRQNRSKKHKKPKNSHSPVKTCPQPSDIFQAKEYFMSDLKQVFSSYLLSFQHNLESKKTCHSSFSPNSLNLNPRKLNYDKYYKLDDSREFHHIFYSQLNKFLSLLLLSLRNLENFNNKFIISCISDAFQILDIARLDIQKIASFLFEGSGIDCRSMLSLIFHEKLIKDRYVQKILADEEFYKQDADVNEVILLLMMSEEKKGKKRTRRKKGVGVVDEGMDREVEEFECRLNEVQVETKFTPRFSDVWIKELSERLKNR